MSFPVFLAVAFVVVVGVVLALVSLISAPWQILLLFLVAVLLLTNRLLAESQKQGEFTSKQDESTSADKSTTSPEATTLQDVAEAEKMLTYRGACYKPPTVPLDGLTNREVSGKYRGGIWRSFN
jgi:membrane protein implicated in regulation of membrane protease activity